VVEVTKVGELVAERIHETRVFERPSGRHVAEANSNRPIRKTDAVASFDIRPLRFEHAIAQVETSADPLGIGFQPRHQLTLQLMLLSTLLSI
jgi:hypothetical protein